MDKVQTAIVGDNVPDLRSAFMQELGNRFGIDTGKAVMNYIIKY